MRVREAVERSMEPHERAWSATENVRDRSRFGEGSSNASAALHVLRRAAGQRVTEPSEQLESIGFVYFIETKSIEAHASE
jgi:hypothetical protein